MALPTGAGPVRNRIVGFRTVIATRPSSSTNVNIPGSLGANRHAITSPINDQVMGRIFGKGVVMYRNLVGGSCRSPHAKGKSYRIPV